MIREGRVNDPGSDDLLTKPRFATDAESGVTEVITHEMVAPGSGLGPTLRRFLIYALVVGASVAGFFEAIRVFGLEALVGERGPLEGVQLLALALSVILLVMSGRRTSSTCILLTAAVPLMALVRELDALFDAVFKGAWNVPFYAVLSCAVVFGVRRRRQIVLEFPRFSSSRSFGLLFSGFLIVCLISRTMGQQSVWQAALGERYLRAIPRITEEVLELVGYMILLLGAIETRYSAPAASDQPAPPGTRPGQGARQ